MIWMLYVSGQERDLISRQSVAEQMLDFDGLQNGCD